MDFETTRLVRQLRSIDRPSDNDTRVQILTAAQALCQRLETPFDWVQRMTWQEVSNLTLSLPLYRRNPRIKSAVIQITCFVCGFGAMVFNPKLQCLREPFLDTYHYIYD